LVLHGEQIRAARSLLGWSQIELARKADVAQMTIRRFEAKDGPVSGTVDSLVRVQVALQRAGIEFIGGPGDGPGVRLWKK
jgi:transcriptional regulator with XRE-family HTH domain